MTTTESGLAEWHDSYAVPDDGDARNVSSVRPAIRAISDRTQLLRQATMPLPALNWREPATTPYAAKDRGALARLPVGTLWLITGSQDIGGDNPMAASVDGGFSWLEFANPTNVCLDVVCDGAETPSILAISNLGNACVYSVSAGTWGTHSIAGDGMAGGAYRNATCGYDAANGSWISIAVATTIAASGPGTIKCRSSDDASTWTARTLPAGFGGSGYDTGPTSKQPLLTVEPENALVAIMKSGGVVEVGYSTDGGHTWGGAAFAAFATATKISRPVFGDGVWMIAAYTDTGTYKTEIWTSPSGSTWTKKKDFSTAIAVTSIAYLGGLWVATAKRGFVSYVLYSRTSGVTWMSGRVLGTGQAVVASDGGFLLFDGTTTIASMQVGTDGGPVQ